MKFVLLASALFVPFFAQAEVKAPGTFVPNLCSVSQSGRISAAIVAVSRVCVGKVVGMDMAVIQMTTNDGESRMYSVKFENRLGGMGASSSKFSGIQMTTRGHGGRDEISGVMSMTSGMTVTHGISLRTSSNLTFRGALEMVFVTQ